MSVVSAAVLLFVVMDPIGNIPLFLSALRDVEPARRRRVVARELAIALGVLAAFLLAGRHVLTLFHISEPSLGIAGGVILFLIALRMVFPREESAPAIDPADREPFVVPLAIPALAGPSAMAVVMLLASREPQRWLDWLAALLGAWLASALILVAAGDLARVLGRRGLVACERLMGMLLTAVAVQMTLNGVRDWLAGLP
jgi:multiple antibiotic resistance protein